MTDDVVDQLVKDSAGLPQYLELARQVAISIKGAGDDRVVQVADVTGSLGSLVMRILDDVPADEQRALRAACLFRIFDVDLVSSAAAVDHGCVERALQRPMITFHDGERFPYRMHDAVREAIRTAGHNVVGGWSERDWQVAASRAAAATRRLHDAAKTDEDNRQVLDALGIAIRLVCEQELTLEPASSPDYPDWLVQAIVYGPSIQGLGSRVPATSATSYGQHVLDFITAKSVESPLEDRLRLLRRTFDSSHPLRLPAGRHLGYILRGHQRWDEALAVFAELVAIKPSPLHLRQGPIVLSMARRFAEARTAAAGIVSAQDYIRRVGEYAHGRPERYFSEVEAKLARYRAAGRQREQIEDQGDLLARRALFVGDVRTADIASYHDQAESAGHSVGVRSALLATVLQRSGASEDRAVALDRLRHMDEAASGSGVVGFRFAMAEVCDSLLCGDRGRLEQLRDQVSSLEFRSRSWIPTDCFLAAVGLPLPVMSTQWLESPATVVRRWTAHLDGYLTRHGVQRAEPSGT